MLGGEVGCVVECRERVEGWCWFGRVGGEDGIKTILVLVP